MRSNDDFVSWGKISIREDFCMKNVARAKKEYYDEDLDLHGRSEEGLQDFDKSTYHLFQVHMLDSGALTSIDLSKFSCHGDLYKKLAEIFNTEEELLASGSFYIDKLLNTEALEKKPWDDLCLVASKIIIYQKQKQVFNNEEIVRNEDLSQESGESKEDFNSQNILNEEGRECEEDFDSQNRVNEEGKNKQLSLRVLATVTSSTLRRASKISEMFGHASSPVISCIIINNNDIFLLVEESLDIIYYGTSCGGFASLKN